MDMVGALNWSWTAQTAYKAEYWTPGNPARGQCAVSALVVQDLLGGHIEKVRIAPYGWHYFNVVPDVGRIDTTASQFPFAVSDVDYMGAQRVDAQALRRNCGERYAMLRRNVVELLTQGRP